MKSLDSVVPLSTKVLQNLLQTQFSYMLTLLFTHTTIIRELLFCISPLSFTLYHLTDHIRAPPSPVSTDVYWEDFEE
ncbi:hypothetical protein O6P43_032833 [Quillaja saponaria]|uniref:Uncharacterized protein n=1 Tax=Quillaja saponaria TaxID=32244 RepID=A0AAD7KNT8_QUISA|nr:hypothetical protein O6P43_032833 [Quillaja saponaria]